MNVSNGLPPNRFEFYAHSRPGKKKQEWQPLIEHLRNTAKIAFGLGENAGLSDLAWITAYLHDIGKYSLEFQRRLDGNGSKVDHASAGAREVMRLAKDDTSHMIAEIISFCIVGHHSGLPDYGSVIDIKEEPSLIARRDKKNLPDYSYFRKQMDLSKITLRARRIKPIKKYPGFSLSFLTRMLFSILVDADWLETESFLNAGKKSRGEYPSLKNLCDVFNLYIKNFKKRDSLINTKRSEILDYCLQKSNCSQGIFTLTVPTGGGKTISSMAFALNHARHHGLKRIIYVIPYTSIIEQNAEVFKYILGQENILEHHSNYDWEVIIKPEDSESENTLKKMKLAAENWDIPIIVTTNVQFFESLFANGKSRVRKIHNIARSVIIFDEVQMLPREYMRPCTCAIQELVQNYSVTAIFCTATQPALKKFFPDLQEFTEISPNPVELNNLFKRVTIQNLGQLPDADLVKKLNSNRQALCIVNTRRHAKAIFNEMQKKNRFHLSTLMCPQHRKETLARVRDRLNHKEECLLVSTQVMEAGVDIDFPVGYRAMAGLDSILQAAGRVNREGKLQGAKLFVFEPESEYLRRTPLFIRQMADVTRAILESGCEITSLEAIQDYYQKIYGLQDENAGFDARQIMQYLDRYEKPNFQFKSASDNFHFIENLTRPIIIAFDDRAKKLITELHLATSPFDSIRNLQNYTINLYEQEYDALMEEGALDLIDGKFAFLSEMSFYNPESGINFPEKERGKAIFI